MSKKNIGILMLIGIIIGIIIAYIVFNKKENNSEIITYELQTHEYFESNSNTDKYLIDSIDELDKFYSIYSSTLNINTDYLKNNSVFIQVISTNSSSNQIKLSSVTFDNNKVNFVIDENIAQIGTMDMAFWYLVAIIPNEKLTDLDLQDWSKPSEIINSAIDEYTFELDSNNKYEIITDSRFKTVMDDGGSNVNIYYQIDLDNKMIKKIKEDYHANLGGTPNTDKSVLYVKTIDEEISKTIENVLDEVISNEDIKDENNYNFFTILTLNNQKDIYNLDNINKINNLLKEFDNLK